jgi:hypothetical protein
MAEELVFQLWAYEAGAADAADTAELAAEILFDENGKRNPEAEIELEMFGFAVDGRARVITTSVGLLAY